MDVHPTKNVSIGIDPYPYIYIYIYICADILSDILCDILHSQLRSGSAHWDLELAVDAEAESSSEVVPEAEAGSSQKN